MYREELAHKKIGAVVGIFITLGIVAAILIIMFVFAFIGFVVKIPWVQWLAVVPIVIAGFLLVKHSMTDYIYILSEGELRFGRKIGAREKELLVLPVRDIKKMGNYQDMAQELVKRRIYRCTFYKKKESYMIDCGDIAVLFSPTEVLKEKLR